MKIVSLKTTFTEGESISGSQSIGSNLEVSTERDGAQLSQQPVRIRLNQRKEWREKIERAVTLVML